MNVEPQTNEEWKQVPGYESLYSVSTLGRVQSTPRPRTKGGLLSTRGSGTGGYQTVCLCKEGREKFVRVHTLVLEAFVSKRPEGMQACHRNGNPRDNRLENLYWGTPSQNGLDKVRHGRCPLTRENRKKWQKI